MQFQISVIAPADAPHTFRTLISPVKLPLWMQDLQSVKSTAGRRSQVGGRSQLHFKDAKSAFQVKEEVTALERNRLFAVRQVHTELTTTVTYTLQPENDQRTRLTVHYRVQFHNPLNRVMALFFKGPMKRQQSQDLQRLVRLIGEEE